MQACIQQRVVAGARPFTATRPAVCRPVAMPSVSRHTAAVQQASPAMQSATVVRGGAAVEADTLSSENVKLRIRMRSYEQVLLADAVEQIRLVSAATGAVFTGPVMLPTKRKVYTVLRSPHVNKDAREQFEIRTHNRLVDVKNLSAETVSAMMSWVPPAGVEVECSLA